MSSFWVWAIRVWAIAITTFQLVTAGAGMLPTLQQRSIFVFLSFGLLFLTTNAGNKDRPRTKVPIWDILIIVALGLGTLHIFLNWFEILSNPTASTTIELIYGAIVTLLVIEAARRNTGKILPIIIILLLIYAIFGDHIPGRWGHGRISLPYLIQTIYLSDKGLWGMITGIGATYVALFVVFGSFITYGGSGQSIVDIAMAIGGRMWGGPAKVATIASAMFGTISGSAVANSAATGNFTIPLMKKQGYSKEFAAGVEATASAGGQFTPPVLGATAFIMAELTGIPYVRIAAAAIIPALLFYIAVFWGIEGRAHLSDLRPLPKEMVPPLRKQLTWTRVGPLALPVMILVGLMVNGYSLVTAAFFASVAAIVFSVFAVPQRAEIWRRIRAVPALLELSGKGVAAIAPMVVAANLIVILFTVTGLAVKLSELIMSTGGSSVFLAALIGFAVVIFLGMGMPTPAAYVLAAAVVGPALLKLGSGTLSVHFFLFYAACLSAITPPICPDVFVTSAIAESNWVKSAVEALKLSVAIYVLAFAIFFEPALLLQGGVWEIARMTITATVGVILMESGAQGYLMRPVGWLARTVLFAAGVLLTIPEGITDLIGLAIAVIVVGPIVFRKWSSRKADYALLANDRR